MRVFIVYIRVFLRRHDLVTILLSFLGLSIFVLLSRCQEYGNKVLESPLVYVVS